MGWLRWLKRTNTEDARLAGWHKAWSAAAEAPDKAGAERLRAALADIGVEDDACEIEREMLEGLEALVELSAAVDGGLPPPIVTGHRAVGGDRCYFSAPASMPDLPAQPCGTLLLTGTRAIFVGGASAVTIPWHLVAACRRQDRDLLLIRSDRPDLHRLRCNTYGDALHAAYVAAQLNPRRRV